MTGPVESGSEQKRCPECTEENAPTFTLEDASDYEKVLEHYLEEHPHCDRLKRAVRQTWVETVCEDCERPFYSPVSADHNGLHIEIYCPECEGKEMIRRLMVKSITPLEYVKYEADPEEDELGDKTGGGSP